MRRSSSRHGGAGRALAASRSVGWKPSSASGSGSIVATVTGPMLQFSNRWHKNVTPAPGSSGSGLLERPLSPRSLIGSLLLGMSPPRMPAARLVEWCGLFGVAEGTSAGRVEPHGRSGELVASDGVYELAGQLRRRQPAQDWSLAPEVAAWSGDWRFGVVQAGPAYRRGPGGDARSGPPPAPGRGARRSVDAARQPSAPRRGRPRRGRPRTRSAAGGRRVPKPRRSRPRGNASSRTRGPSEPGYCTGTS